MGVEAVATRCPEWEGKYWRFENASCVLANINTHTAGRHTHTHTHTHTQQARRHTQMKKSNNKSATLIDVLEHIYFNASSVFPAQSFDQGFNRMNKSTACTITRSGQVQAPQTLTFQNKTLTAESFYCFSLFSSQSNSS